MTLLQKFLEQIRILKSKNLTYRQPGDGSDGTCDCIGLIIGALRRIGIKWIGKTKPAIHGSNYAARYEIRNLRYISDPKQLKLGDIVFKAREPGHSKYALPDRYKGGKSYFNGDLRDYYHVGVVTSINPFNITHMTSPTMRVDTKLDHNRNSVWNYGGSLIKLDEAGASQPATDVIVPTPVPVKPGEDARYATVYSANGKPVKMRAKPSTKCTLWENIDNGTRVKVLDWGDDWSNISAAGKTGWYMMTKFLKEEKQS